ncbi:MAG: hypothetical protein ACSLFP_06985, partial [Acidimicrobiales bacterium]
VGSGGDSGAEGLEGAIGGPDSTECDPETGICGGSEGVGPVTGGVGAISATPTVLAAASGWGSTESLIVIVVGLMLALVFAPALLSRRLTQKGGPS